MARYPHAIWKPIGRHNRGARIPRHNRMNLHVAVSEAASLFGYFSGVGDCSHFYVRKDGTVEQYMDTAYYSKSDYQGNDATISVETQGGVHNANSEPWTDAQVKALAALWAWARDTHGIPNQLATTSRYDSSSRGLSYHRLGVPTRSGNRTSQTGGMLWSRAGGKICPGQGKIDQIPGIWSIANGGSVPAPKPTPTPAPAPKPKPQPSVPQIAVDGQWGPGTTRRLQQYFGTTQDGVISGQVKGSWNQNVHSAQWGRGGSQLIAAIQKRFGLATDGNLGPQTIRRMQKHFGTTQDGVISSPSEMVKAMQRRLNANTF